MSKSHDILVECCRCRNVHMESERVSVPDFKFRGLSSLVCPRCSARSYYDLRPEVAYCFASGQIEFGDIGTAPAGSIAIATGPKSHLRSVVGALARNSRSSSALLVPGVPEAIDQTAAGDALAAWLSWAALGNGKKGRHGVLFNVENRRSDHVVS